MFWLQQKQGFLQTIREINPFFSLQVSPTIKNPYIVSKKKHKIEWFQVLQVNSPWQKQPQHDEFPMFKALLYLALVMGGVYWSAGAWSRGILEANGTFDARHGKITGIRGDWLAMEFSWLIYG